MIRRRREPKPYVSTYEREMLRAERYERLRAFLTGCAIGAAIAVALYAWIVWDATHA